MKKFSGYECGMGMGGWLTNYKRFNVLPMDRRLVLTIGDFEHFERYITESDVKSIASLGFDHIRLGFDQIVLEEAPFTYRESIFKLIDRFIAQCDENGINVLLNLHKAIGNYCDIAEEVTLFDSAPLQDRVIALWTAFAKRYRNCKNVAFELLNEVRDIPPEQWNVLADRCIQAIRAISPERIIMVGSTCWNDAAHLKDLKIWDDDLVVYTFHMYQPFEFTHQRGVLQANPLFYNREMPYPGDIAYYRDYQRVVYGEKHAYAQYDRMDKKFIRDCLQPAADWIAAHPDRILHCGEFGTIRHCRLEWRENWMRDVIVWLRELGIPSCVWNYLSTPNDGNRFSLVDDDRRQILSPELLQILLGKG